MGQPLLHIAQQLARVHSVGQSVTVGRAASLVGLRDLIGELGERRGRGTFAYRF